MKKILTAAAAALLLAGCATENGTVQTAPGGTKVYGLNDQPQTSVAGEGTLMPGAYNPRDLPTGQFTGQARTHDMIGQRPTLPRETDARMMERTPAQNYGMGAGALGQTGLAPGQNTIDTTLNPGATPSASDIYRSGAAQGGAPGLETASGNSTTNNPSLRR